MGQLQTVHPLPQSEFRQTYKRTYSIFVEEPSTCTIVFICATYIHLYVFSEPLAMIRSRFKTQHNHPTIPQTYTCLQTTVGSDSGFR